MIRGFAKRPHWPSMALMVEQRQRRDLWALISVLVIVLTAGVLVAVFATSGWSDRLIAIGLALEIAGALAIILRPLVEDIGFWMIRGEADRITMRVFIGGAASLALGFALQFVAVVFL